MTVTNEFGSFLNKAILYEDPGVGGGEKHKNSSHETVKEKSGTSRVHILLLRTYS